MTPIVDEAEKSLKRERLIAAAAQVFAAKGYRKATMDEIARLAGTAKGTVYLYFKDKESLFYAVFEWLASASFENSTVIERNDLSAAQRLLALAEATVVFMTEHREMFPLTLEVWAAAGSTDSRERFATAMKDLYATYRLLIAEIIQNGQQRGELRSDLNAQALGSLLAGAVDGLLLQSWFDPDLNPLPLLRDFFDPLIRGMLTQPTETEPKEIN